MKRVIGMVLAAVLILGLTGCGSAVKTAEKAIEKIGEVSLESEDAIAEARKAYDKLSEYDRQSLSNAETLFRAEERLQILKVENAIDSFTEITPAAKEKIEQAQALYEALDPALRDQVSNRSRLETADLVLKVSDAINNLPEITLDEGEKLTQAKELYESIDPEYRGQVANADKLEAACTEYYGLVYQKAEELYGEWEKEDALEYYRKLPEDYEDAAAKAEDCEKFAVWREAQSGMLNTWVWDGEWAVGSDGKRYPADYKTLIITKDEEAFHWVPAMGFDVVIATEKTEPKLSKQGILNGLPKAVKDSINAGNIQFSSLSYVTEPSEDSLVVVFGGMYVFGGSKSYMLDQEFHLLADGRLRVDYLLKMKRGDEHLVFYYEALQ